MRFALKITAFIVLIALAACDQNQNGKELMVQVDTAEMAQKAASPQKPEPIDANQITERKITKEGHIMFQTGNAKKTQQLIAKTVVASNAYISEDEINNFGGERTEHRVTVRIPAEKFDSFLATISESADNLESKKVSAKDVTEEYVDIEARIKTKKELEARYAQLLQRAAKVSEVLEIEKETGTLRAEIESIEGRLRYLKSQVAFSTLTIVYYEKGAVSFGFFTKFTEALANGWVYLQVFLIALVSLWPFFLLGAVGYFLLKRFQRRKKTET